MGPFCVRQGRVFPPLHPTPIIKPVFDILLIVRLIIKNVVVKLENTANTKDFSEIEKEVSDKFDEFGKSLEEEFFQLINGLLLRSYPQNEEKGLRAFMSLLGIGASFVFDSNAIQKVIRYELKGGKSSALSAIKSGFVTALCPPDIEFEISNHTLEIAEYCETTPVRVMEFYHKEIRPYIQLMEVSDQELFEKIKADIKDKDDAPFVALGLETNAIGIVTEDGVIKDQEGIKTYRLEDIARVHVHFRKRGVVIFLSILNVIAFFLFIKTILSFFGMIINFVKNNPKLVLGILAGATLIYFLFREEINQKFKESFGEKWEKIKSQMGLIWEDLSPYLLAAFMQICQRMQDTEKELKQLTDGKAERLTSFRPQESNSRLPLSKWIEQILIALKKPLSLKEIRSTLKSVGFQPRGKNTIYYEVKKALELNPNIIRNEDGCYLVNA